MSPAAEHEWKDLDDTFPDWNDTGKVELKREDGSIERATLIADEVWTGEDEIPVFTVILPDGSRPDFFTFKSWRRAA